jgi:hypothetical protein
MWLQNQVAMQTDVVADMAYHIGIARRDSLNSLAIVRITL